jgi:hypothetical protein
LLGGEAGAFGGVLGSAAAGTSSFDAAARGRARMARRAGCAAVKAAGVDRVSRYRRGKHGIMVPFGKTTTSADGAAAGARVGRRRGLRRPLGAVGTWGCAAAGADGAAGAGGAAADDAGASGAAGAGADGAAGGAAVGGAAAGTAGAAAAGAPNGSASAGCGAVSAV